MALDKDFYNDIYDNEESWINQIENNLINVIYCDYVLKAFYLIKRKKLKEEYYLTKEEKVANLIDDINLILNKIEEFGNAYRNGENVDIQSIIPLFLVSKKSKKNDLPEKDIDKIRSQVLKSISKKLSSEEDFDYTYDDFPNESYKSM